MTDNEYKYWAFLCFSQEDNREKRPEAQGVSHRCWGNWLHDALKTFSIPTDFVGQSNGRGEKIPERIQPIFQEQQGVAEEIGLSEEVRGALEHSRCLIVICSPRSAGSARVNEIVRYFKQVGRGRPILPIVVAGEPNASEGNQPSISPQDECFVPALRHPLQVDGTLDLTRRAGRFVFVDARQGADKREILAQDHRNAEADLEMAKIHLIALVVGVGFNGLWWREQKRHFFDLAEAQHQTKEALDQAEEARRQNREAQNKAVENLPGDVQGQIQEAQHQALEAQNQAREAQKQLQEFQNKVRETQSQLEEARARAQAAESRVLEAQQQAQNSQSQLDELRHEAQDAQNKLLETQSQVQEFQSRAQSAQSQLEEARQQIEEVQRQAREAQSQALETPNPTGNVDGQLQESQRQALEAQNQAREAQRQLEEFQNKAQLAQSQLEEARQQIEEFQRQATAAQSQALEVSTQSNNTDAQFKEAQRQVLEAQSQARETQRQLEEFQNTVRDTQGQLEDARSRAVATESKVLEAQQQAQNVQSLFEETRNQAQDAQNKFLEAQGQVQELQSRALSAQSELEAARHEVRTMQSKVLEAQEEARAAHNKVQETQNDVRDAQSLIKGARDLVQDTQSKGRNARRLAKAFAFLAVLSLLTAGVAVSVVLRQRKIADQTLAKATAEEAGKFDPAPGGLDGDQIRQVLGSIGGAEQEENRPRSLDELAAWIPKDEIPDTLKASSEILNDPQRSHFQKWLLLRQGWANPVSAMTLAGGIEGKIVNDEGEDDSNAYFQLAVLDNWMRTDLTGAFNWVCGLPDGDARQRALEKIVPTLAANDPQNTLARLNDLKPAADERIYTLLFARWAAHDPAQAIQQRQLIPGHDQGDAILCTIVTVWMSQQPEAALDWVKFQPDSESKTKALEICIGELAKTDVPGAMMMAESLPEGDLRNMVIAGLYNEWAARDSKAAMHWLEKPDGAAEIMQPRRVARPWAQVLVNLD